MPPLTALRAQLNVLLQIDTAYDLSYGTKTDCIQTGARLPSIAKALSLGTDADEADSVCWIGF